MCFCTIEENKCDYVISKLLQQFEHVNGLKRNEKQFVTGHDTQKNSDRNTQQIYRIPACYRGPIDTGMTRHKTTIKCDFLSSFPNFHFAIPPCFLWPTQPSNRWVPAFFTGSKSGRDVMLNIHCHPVPRLRMSGAIPLLPIYVFQVMDRESFTFIFYHNIIGGTQWRSWLRHCATSRKVAGSIPDGVIILPAALWNWG